MNSPMPCWDAGVCAVCEELKVEGCRSQASDSWHGVYVFHLPHMHKHDSSSNMFLGTENLRSVVVKDKSKVLGILRNPAVTYCIFLGPDDAWTWVSAEEHHKGIWEPEDLSREMVHGWIHGTLWIRQDGESSFHLFGSLE